VIDIIYMMEKKSLSKLLRQLSKQSYINVTSKTYITNDKEVNVVENVLVPWLVHVRVDDDTWRS
jgi:uncharacterized protein YpbB